MDLVVTPVDVWAAPIPDRPGGLAVLLDTLQSVSADLQCIIARRDPTMPGKGVVYVTPLRGDRQIAAASQLGFNVTHHLHSVMVMGPNRPGIAAEITSKIAESGVNLRGFNASSIGSRFVAYIGVDSIEDANLVRGALELFDAANA